ncbi:MAG TPA: substrate-binding domain-containing protein [Anaerolineae bacterium]|nr:substrate-binding domain-containing protein [Anaerolineae bacterium]
MNQFLTRKAARFLAILGGGIAVALALWLATNVFNVALPGVDTSPIEVRLIVAPAAYEWVSAAATQFNAQGQRLNRRPITLRAVAQDGVGVYHQLNSSGLRPPPSAWIAEGTFAVDLANLGARQAGGPDVFAAEGSVAQSVLMWGSFSDRVAALDARFGGLSWSALHEAALAVQGWSSLGGRAEWGFFKMVLADPNKSSEGLAALLSAAAEFHGKNDLTAADISDPGFQQWAQALIDAVPSFANLGLEPARALALRGPSAGDVGLLLESDLLSAASGLFNWQPPVLRYAVSAVAFDFPFAVWVGPEVGGDSGRRNAEQEAARLFRDYLLSDAQQRQAETLGLRPATGNAADTEGSLFARWMSLGVQPGRPATASVNANAEAVLAALRWVNRVAKR